MSGGLDSSVAALVLKRQGYEVVGVFLHLWKGKHLRSCCSAEAALRAQMTADRMGIPLYVIGAEERFRSAVVSFFKERYEAGETPNPCIECNRHIKFTLVAEQTAALGADRIATGHYARLELRDGEIHLRRARDPHKDQSYFLYSVPRDLLRRLILPLGDWTKEEVREYAKEAGLPAAGAPESMDLCFFQDGVDEFFASRRVEFVDAFGNRIGEATRPMFFSIGQRKGLGIAAGSPLFVRDICAAEGRVVLARRDGLFAKSVALRNVTWVAPRCSAPFVAQARHRSSAAPATVRFSPSASLPDGQLKVDSDETADGERGYAEFERPVWAPATGQSLVVYDGDRVICGGIISRIHWNP
jgi:tRNA-specific 2-thiouridylase